MAKVRQLLIGLASGSALYSGMAPALGLGEITLHSALSQPLDAEIELLNVGDLNDSEVKVRLAPTEVFNRSGVDRLYFLNDLRFTPLLRGGSSVIRVVSARPVREPYLNFIVEVTQPSGQLYREYTVLLDPPGSSAYRTLAAPAALPATAPSVRSASQASAVSSAPAPAPERVSAPRPTPVAEQGQRYSVVSGDSLWKIAARLRAAGSQVSQQGLMSDIHALNPQAFINGDLNRLRAGADLLLPDSAVAQAPVVAPAAAPVLDVAAEPAQEAPPAAEVAVEAPASAAEPVPQADELSVDPAAQLLVQEQAQVDQELANQIAETTRLQQSLAELGLQVQQLQAEMSLRDQQIAGLQAELAARRAATDSTAVSAAAETAQAAPAAASESALAEQLGTWLKASVALLALLLVGLFGLFWRFRNRPEPAEVPPAVAVAAKAVAAPVPAAAPAKAVKAAVALSALEVANGGPTWPAAENKDALQSANVYIAYGRFSEAADLLRKALQAQPQRSDIGFRLLEVLAQLGDAPAFAEQEASLRAAGFSPVRIDELRARHGDLFKAAPADLMGDAVLQLDETPEVLADDLVDDSKLNLDELSLDADWDLVSPFSPTAQNTVAGAAEKASPAAASKDTKESKETDVFDLAGSRDARSPFAETMLVEEAPNDDWLDDELDEAFLEQPKAPARASVSSLDDLAGSRDNLAKLNMALAYIEQGSLDSACSILNEVINSGDEKQKQRARQLLAKIA